MNNDTIRQYGPWALIMIALGGAAYVVLPVLERLVWNVVSLTVGGLALAALFWSLPLLAMILRNLLWRARKEVIEAMPIETLETGLAKIKDGITEFKKRIAAGKAQHALMKDKVTRSREILSEPDYQEQVANLDKLQTMIDRQEEARRKLEAVAAKVERNVEAAKTKRELGLGFGAAARALSAGADGGATSDMNIAFESINRQLVEAQAMLDSALDDVLGAPAAARPQQAALMPGTEPLPDHVQANERKILASRNSHT